MNPISIGLNLLLAALLGLTLWVGWRLNRRLTALRDGQAQFAAAVAELDRAAARAERGLSQLRVAGDETLELLSGRVEKGRELAGKLERLNDEPALPPAIAALQKVWGTAANDKSDADLSLEEAEAAAESLILKLSTAEVLPDEPVSPLAARLAAKSRTIVDDDLFETPGRPAPRILAGGR